MSLKALASKSASRPRATEDERPVKRNKLEDNATRLTDTLYQIICHSRVEILNKIRSGCSLDTIEFELRLGMIVTSGGQFQRWMPRSHSREQKVLTFAAESSKTGLEFFAGLDECDFDEIRRNLKGNERFVVTETTQAKVRIDSQGRRAVQQTDGSYKFSERKDRFFRRNMAMLSENYDIRIGR